MLTDTITLTDSGAATHSYSLVSRSGMESMRRETNVSSSMGSVLSIKNTIDLNNDAARNRHLVQFSTNEIDAVTGEKYPLTVHVVISRHKSVSDTYIVEKCSQLADFLNATNIAEVLIGGN